MSHEIANFFGVYLLYNVNPKFKGRTYIGKTTDPNRRIDQHNKGKQAGGAWRTHGRGPWEMVLIIHGFPNAISALRFEWAWQNPEKSRRLRNVPGKRKKETPFLYRFRVVSEMLNTGPWDRLALTIRWLKQNYVQDFPPNSRPPMHMPIAYGPVKIKKMTLEKSSKSASNKEEDEELIPLSQTANKHPRCTVCRKYLKEEDTTLKCVHPKCTMVSHIICLAKKFLKEGGQQGQIIPVDGRCPRCQVPVLWADLIRLKTGCYQNLEECMSGEENTEEDHWADQLQTQDT
ncbi:hypothetical protein FSP39_004064 [Pinctada imbricata]|uniref:Structure-specific endonuclease subunit SLX1 homolog n=1 Tax=Pinctada imbricata TaxID=66713 RepID=A0AA88XED7_PINIB|nr:hypothetical protein FSP39_004064 [Pinctada imbricata]